MSVPTPILFDSLCTVLRGRTCLYGARGIESLVIVDDARIHDGTIVIDLRFHHYSATASERVVAATASVSVDAMRISLMAKDGAAELIHAPPVIADFCDLLGAAPEDLPPLPQQPLLPGLDLERVELPLLRSRP